MKIKTAHRIHRHLVGELIHLATPVQYQTGPRRGERLKYVASAGPIADMARRLLRELRYSQSTLRATDISAV